MLQWLNGNENTQVGAERELRPRDDGAVLARRRPRRLHRGRHPRTGPGADRLAQRLVGRARRLQLPLRLPTPRQRARRRCSGRPAAGTGKTPAGCASRTPCTRRSSSQKLWSYFVPQPPSDAVRERSDQHLPRLGLGNPPGARGDPDQPRPLRRPADGEAARRPPGRHAAEARPRHRHRGLDLALRPGRSAPLLAAQRLRLGRHAAGSTPRRMRARWNLVYYALDGISVDAWGDPYSSHRDRRRSAGAGARLLGLAVASRRTPGRAARLRPALPSRW